MKYVISFFISFSALASPIHIFFEGQKYRAELVKEIFVQNYMIPEDLMTLKEVQNCDGVKRKGKLDVCLKNNGDLQVVSVDRGFINESLKIFQAP